MNLLHIAIDSGLKITLPVETVIVTVSDSSVGITLDNQMHIFERFYKTDKACDHAFGGNGLGLSLVKKIIDLHITADSKPRGGSGFSVLLSIKK